MLGILTVVSCEENDIPIFDVENGRSIAGFSGLSNQSVVFNPAGSTENTITVGVSNLSDQDRAVEVRIDEASTTLDPSFYSVSDLTPVIPAGQFTTDITVTTIPGESLPDAGDVLVLELVSVEGGEFLEESVEEVTLGLDVQCPEVELANIPGTYVITEDAFGTHIDEGEFEIVAGPDENQFTMVNPFGHPEEYDVVFSVDPETGSVTVARQAAWHCDNFGCAYGEGRVEGPGQVLTCIDQINFNLTHTVNAGSFGTYGLTINKI